MKTRIVLLILVSGILVVGTMSVAGGGKRVISDNKTPAKVEQKDPVGQAPRAPDNDVETVNPAGVLTDDFEQSITGLMPAAPVAPPDAAEYDIPWQSINAGGEDMQSTNYQISSSVGQSVIGYATSDNYQAGIGYWYGTGGEGCDCGAWGDVDGSGGVPKPPDVTFLVQYVYFTNDMRVQPPNCPYEAGDVDCSGGAPKPPDVTFMVQYVYFTNDLFCPDPCGP